MNIVATVVGYSVVVMLCVSGLVLSIITWRSVNKLLIAIAHMSEAIGFGLLALGGWIGPSAINTTQCIWLTVIASVSLVVSLLFFGNLTAKRQKPPQ